MPVMKLCIPLLALHGFDKSAGRYYLTCLDLPYMWLFRYMLEAVATVCNISYLAACNIAVILQPPSLY